jgi:hypothetical protein
MNIAFWDNSLSERGTTVSLYDYAYYNQTILKNKSYIFYEKNRNGNNESVIEKFKKHFTVNSVNEFAEVDEFLEKYNITHIYIIKSGQNDGNISKVAKNCIHCVFNCNEPHGDVYSSISPWVNGNNGKYPVVPHMINIPSHDRNMKKKLKIPENAVVFGGYGGSTSFNIPFVHKVVYMVAKLNPKIYFLFANFNKFCPDLPNIIHLPPITNLNKKVEFINTTDAMLWGRSDGETFGIAIGEFSTRNKPVICTDIGYLAHIHLLGDKSILYTDQSSLYKMLIDFDPKVEKTKDWNAYVDYTPEKVMQIFNDTYLMSIRG